MPGRLKSATRVAVLAAMCGGTMLAADATGITIAPTGYITVGVGGTKQFTATVTGMSGMSTAVNWSVGRPGLNTGLGSISSTGLYTAPSVLPSNTQIQIAATLVATPSVSAVTYLYLLPTGPTITSVSPNPQTVGSFKVTIQGTGFVSGAMIMDGGVQYPSTFVNSTTITTNVYQGPATSTSFYVINPGSTPSNTISVPVTSKSGSGGGGGTGGSGGGGGGGSTPAPVVSPANVTLALLGTQQFTASNTTSWAAAAGTITASGMYTAPAAMPASGKDTVTATGPGGTGTATITLVSNVAPTIQSIGTNPLPLGVFSTTITGTGFGPGSTATLGSSAVTVTSQTATTLTVTGFAGTGGSVNLTVANGPVASQPFPVQVGVANPMVSASAARRFL